MTADKTALIESVYNLLRRIEETDSQRWLSAAEIKNLLLSDKKTDKKNKKKGYIPLDKTLKNRIYSDPITFFPEESLPKIIAEALKDLKKIGEITKLYKIDIKEYDEYVPGSIKTTKYHYQSNISREVMRLMCESCAGIECFPSENRKTLYDIISIIHGKDYGDKVKNISDFPEDGNHQSKMLSVLTALHKIIDQNHSKCQMGKNIYLSASVKYCSYNKDKQLENPQKMVVIPLKVIVHKGECYLVCKEQKMKHFSFLRVDRITYVYPDKARVSASVYSKMLKDSASKTPFMDEGTKEIEILFDKKYLNNVLDWFGKEIKITTEKDGRYSAKVNVINEKIIRLTMM